MRRFALIVLTLSAVLIGLSLAYFQDPGGSWIWEPEPKPREFSPRFGPPDIQRDM